MLYYRKINYNRHELLSINKAKAIELLKKLSSNSKGMLAYPILPVGLDKYNESACTAHANCLLRILTLVGKGMQS